MKRLYIHLAVLGDSRIGKTLFIRRWILNEDNFESEPSLMVQLRLGEIDIDSEVYPIAVYELSAKPKFVKYSKQFLGIAHVVIFLFDVTDLNTLEVLKKHWFSCVEHYMVNASKHGLSSRIIFVGNKIDLLSSTEENKVLKKVRNLIAWHDVPVFLISVKTGEGIDKLIKHLKKLLKERIIPVLKNVPYEFKSKSK
ncbi:MAG: ADP-ribosylation factor-like protein [Candidatus Asgardarchaeia archaeon]